MSLNPNKKRDLTNDPTALPGARQAQALPPPMDGGRLADHAYIDEGGMGAVWQARDVRLNRWVAVKRVLAELSTEPELIQRFRNEASILAQLNHPNVVTIYSLGHDSHGYFIEMELIRGSSLLKLIEQKSIYPVEEAVRLVRKVCEGLHAVHEHKIVHRDIKPSNILVNTAGLPKLIDFGIANATTSGSALTLTGQRLGTDGYMAPEQMEDAANATAASDQYSLAATLYQMVTGISPRRIDLRKVPEALYSVLDRALEDEPTLRFANIAEFHRSLGAALRTTAKPGSRTTASEASVDLALRVQHARNQAAQKLAAARAEYENYNDQAVIEILRSVHVTLCDLELRKRAVERLNRTSTLESEIKVRVGRRETLGLRGLVDDYLSLYPHSPAMIALQGQLPPEPELLYSPFTKSMAEASQQAWALHLGVPVEFKNSIGMRFRLIPPGEFLMGSTDEETDASMDEKPQHKVRITKPFYLGVTPVTRFEYHKVTSNNSIQLKGNGSLPARRTKWVDAQLFIGQLRSIESGKVYRLPTEAEWEYSCRAGTTTPFWFGKELNGSQANCDGNYPYGTAKKGPFPEKTVPVAKYGSNPFGIYDQHGQVWEWCQDWYDPEYYNSFVGEVAIDPHGPSIGSSHCCRGGSWFNRAAACRSACRFDYVPADSYSYFGFRVALGIG